LNEKNTHNSSGINAGFSQTINVVDGEMYFLAIDNVYENGGGATIEFMYFEEQIIEGTVLDSEKKPVEAEVVWENAKTGTELSVARSNAEDGSFKIIVPYEKGSVNKYTLSIFSDDCLFEEITYTPIEIETKSSEKLNVILPKLKKGLKAPINSINFAGGKSILLKTAYPSLRRLVKLMKKNKELKIHIVGHTNGCDGSITFNQELSESRAEITQEYLINKGIKGDRITTEGRNCQEMLYSITSNEKLQALNRRIEVNVTSY
jgi:outer membrane protein OmpA-like peptidoglycan-associated protein